MDLVDSWPNPPEFGFRRCSVLYIGHKTWPAIQHRKDTTCASGLLKSLSASKLAWGWVGRTGREGMRQTQLCIEVKKGVYVSQTYWPEGLDAPYLLRKGRGVKILEQMKEASGTASPQDTICVPGHNWISRGHLERIGLSGFICIIAIYVNSCCNHLWVHYDQQSTECCNSHWTQWGLLLSRCTGVCCVHLYFYKSLQYSVVGSAFNKACALIFTHRKCFVSHRSLWINGALNSSLIFGIRTSSRFCQDHKCPVALGMNSVLKCSETQD